MAFDDFKKSMKSQTSSSFALEVCVLKNTKNHPRFLRCWLSGSFWL